MIFKKDEFKTLWPFYLDHILSPILYFSAAFLVVYFIGLDFSVFQIGILIAALPLTQLLFEIPTGAISDIYGRKFSVLVGYTLEGLGYLGLFFLTNFYSVLFMFALIGFGGTFSSGSKEAWITDLVKSKKGKYLKDYFIKERSFDSFGLFLSGIIGALIVAKFGLSIMWIFTAMSFLLSIILLLFAEEKYAKRKVPIKDSFKNLVKQSRVSISYSRKHPMLFYFFIASFIFVFAFAFNESLTWTPFLLSFGFPDYAFGYLWSGISLVMAISPWIANKFNTEGKERNFIIFTVAISTLIILLIVFVQSLVFALVISILSIFFFTIGRPVERVYFHRFIPSKLRATVGSIEGMIYSLAGIISIPLVGLSVDIFGPRNSILVGGLLMIPGIIIYLKIKEK